MVASLKNLQKEKTRLLKIREKELQRLAEIQKRRDLQREVFMLKHGKKIETAKRLGKSLQRGVIKTQKWAEKRQRRAPKRSGRRPQGNDYGFGDGSLF